MFAAPTVKTIYKRKKRNVLDLFSVEGEGGYFSQNYTFMFKSSAFFNDNILASVKGVINPTKAIKTLTIAGKNYNYIDNTLRVSLGNNNNCVIYRDGTIDINKSTSLFPFVRDNCFNVRDTFTPSSYATDGTQFQQMLLMDNGDLILIDCLKKTNKTLLTGVDQFITKNQAHRCDAIIAMKNDDVYHVWIGPTPVGVAGNGTASGVVKVNGIKASSILFASIGDNPAHAVFCLKSDKRNLYRFVKGVNTDFTIKGVDTTPITNMKLTDPEEYYVDGMAQEFNGLYLTNKKLMHRHTGCSYTSNDFSVGWDRPFTDTPTIYARKISTPTAYSMIVEDIFGKFWLCDNGSAIAACGGFGKPDSYVYFDNLKTYLEPIRAAMK
jgi:hypothetical protein